MAESVDGGNLGLDDVVLVESSELRYARHWDVAGALLDDAGIAAIAVVFVLRE